MFWPGDGPGTWAGVARGHGLTSIDCASQSTHICLSSTAAVNWYHNHNYNTTPDHCHGTFHIHLYIIHILPPKWVSELLSRVGMRKAINWLAIFLFIKIGGLEVESEDTMDKIRGKWLQFLDVATLVSTRGRDDLSVCLLRSSPACVCTAPSVLGLLLINLVHYLFSCAGLRGHQPLCADGGGGTNVGCSDTPDCCCWHVYVFINTAASAPTTYNLCFS